MKNVTPIGEGKKEDEFPLLRAKINFKEGDPTSFDFHFMGHSVENPMMLTLIRMKEKDEEIPVAMLNCDVISYVQIEEIES